MTSISVLGSASGSSAWRVPPPPPPSNSNSSDNSSSEEDPTAAAARLGLLSSATASVSSSGQVSSTAPAVEPRGDSSSGGGFRDPEKLDQLSGLLNMDKNTVSTEASSATKLVELLQKNGVDLGALKNVLSSGDLLDVRA